mgnify:CR=1 FL=1
MRVLEGYLMGLLILCAPIQFCYGAMELLQSFEEANTRGATYFGYSVSAAGDVNNDGYDDIIIGAYEYNSHSGRVYIYYGGQIIDHVADVILDGEEGCNFGMSVSQAGDINQDGYDDVIIGAAGYNSCTGRAFIYYGSETMDNIADVILNGENTDDQFGRSVSAAGDVNNDGYDDIVVGAWYYNSRTGRVYLYYGSDDMDDVADVTMTGETTFSFFGESISKAGDVNKDGFDDIIVGIPRYNNYMGRTHVYYGGVTMDNMPDVTMTGESSQNQFGCSVCSAGDVNNDGYDDVIVGAKGYNSYTGRAYIYNGGASMDSYADITMTGEATGDNFGCSVSTAGNVNNDDYDDVIVGANGYGDQNIGRVYVYYGEETMDNGADIIMNGQGNHDQFGCSVSAAGDVNNDDYDDIVIGAYYYNSGTGRAYVFYGSENMDNVADVVCTGEGSGNRFGYSVSNAGDVNGDSFDDIIVGAIYYTDSMERGRVYIYYGGINIDNLPDVVITSQTQEDLGCSVSGAGDVNNDGYDDVIIGASYYDTNRGRAYIYYGGAIMDNIADVTLTEGTDGQFGCSVSSAGDINNDGYDDVVVGAWLDNCVYFYYGSSSMDNSYDRMLMGESEGRIFGCSVSCAGDVNNDGYDDVIIGDEYYDTASYSYVGRAYIYYGPNLRSYANVILDGENVGNFIYFGCSVSDAGDVNNDGYDDVIVGSRGYDSYRGRAYIYLGGIDMDNTADVTVSGEVTINEFGRSVSTTGDVNNDGYDDVIIGAYRYNSYAGRAYIYYGGSSMDNSSDVIIDGEFEGDYLGYCVSGGGDFNNDNFDDVLVGAYEYPVNGKVYFYSENNPVAVKISSFTATVEGDSVVLNWHADSEINHAGYNIWRCMSDTDHFIKVNPHLIFASGSNPAGVDYEFIDYPHNPAIYYYKLEDISLDGVSHFSDPVKVNLSTAVAENSKTPHKYKLHQNHPNPFNPKTMIRYELPAPAKVILTILDMRGRIVNCLVNQNQSAGLHHIAWDGTDDLGLQMPSGLYFYRIKAGDICSTRKMTLLR